MEDVVAQPPDPEATLCPQHSAQRSREITLERRREERKKRKKRKEEKKEGGERLGERDR